MIRTTTLTITVMLATTAATAELEGSPRDEPVAEFVSSTDEPLVTSLEKSLQPFSDRFNKDKGKLRFVTLLSPTGGGCMRGARGVLRSIVQDYPDLDISVNVVWVPMLASDNEAAARRISSMFDDPRVHQYWDPERRSGIAYTRSFPTMFRDMVASLPREHRLHPVLSKRVDASPERAPMWDAAFFYDRSAEWSAGPPKPADWIKQVMYYGGRTDGVTGLFWLDDFATPPIDTDWWVELSQSMKKMTGAEPARPQRKDARERKGDAATGASKSGRIDAKEEPVSKPKAKGKTGVVSLADSLAPLQKRFNAATDKLRFVALLSPT